jgi:prepilin-type N-terminal cleavage/methylation domain-containing protein/prepilin-type processing-associated H-X9-DG protein
MKRFFSEWNSMKKLLHGLTYNRAFTLLELLIVIAIIMILAAILLPGLNRSRQLSKSIYCANNLKNINMGFGMYASDWDGYFVPYKYPNGSYIHWPYGIDPYIGGKAKSGWCFSYRHDFGSSMAWYCPSGPVYKEDTSGRYRSDYIDYAYNISLGGYGSGGSKQIHSISRPSKVLLCLDSRYPGFDLGIAYIINNSDDRIHARHNNRFNVVFIDGHVHNFTFTSLPMPISTNLIGGTW